MEYLFYGSATTGCSTMRKRIVVIFPNMWTVWRTTALNICQSQVFDICPVRRSALSISSVPTAWHGHRSVPVACSLIPNAIAVTMPAMLSAKWVNCTDMLWVSLWLYNWHYRKRPSSAILSPIPGHRLAAPMSSVPAKVSTSMPTSRATMPTTIVSRVVGLPWTVRQACCTIPRNTSAASLNTLGYES